MSSFIGRVVRSKTLVKLVDSTPRSYGILRHLLRIGLSNYLFMYKLPLLLPVGILLLLVFTRNFYTSLMVQISFVVIHLVTNLFGRRERLRRFSPILRELFHYQNRGQEGKIALLHLGSSVVLYSFNWLLLGYYVFMKVFP